MAHGARGTAVAVHRRPGTRPAVRRVTRHAVRRRLCTHSSSRRCAPGTPPSSATLRSTFPGCRSRQWTGRTSPCPREGWCRCRRPPCPPCRPSAASRTRPGGRAAAESPRRPLQAAGPPTRSPSPPLVCVRYSAGCNTGEQRRSAGRGAPASRTGPHHSQWSRQNRPRAVQSRRPTRPMLASTGALLVILALIC